jgi:hypothetical protein
VTVVLVRPAAFVGVTTKLEISIDERRILMRE